MSNEKLHQVEMVRVPDISTDFDTSPSHQPGVSPGNSKSLQSARSQAHQQSLLCQHLPGGMEMATARGQEKKALTPALPRTTTSR